MLQRGDARDQWIPVGSPLREQTLQERLNVKRIDYRVPVDVAGAIVTWNLAIEQQTEKRLDIERVDVAIAVHMAWGAQALAASEEAVSDALANPKKMKAARGFLTGQVMKLSGGNADPKLVARLIDSQLSTIERP